MNSQVLNNCSSEESEVNINEVSQISNRTRGQSLEYYKVREFESAIIAKCFVKSEKLWLQHVATNTFAGRKIYYNCKNSRDCSAKLYLLLDPESNIVSLFKTNSDHNCSAQKIVGIDRSAKVKVLELSKSGVKPKAILRNLQEAGLNVPKMKQLHSFLNYEHLKNNESFLMDLNNLKMEYDDCSGQDQDPGGSSACSTDFQCTEQVLETNKILYNNLRNSADPDLDLTLIAKDGQEINCHKVILKTCPYFKCLIDESISTSATSSALPKPNDKLVLVVLDCNGMVLDEIVKFLYIGEISFFNNNIDEILQASIKFGLLRLKNICYNFKKSQKINLDNWVDLFKIGNEQNDEELIRDVLQFLVQNENFHHTENFLSLDFNEVKILAKNLTNSMIATKAIIKWRFQHQFSLDITTEIRESMVFELMAIINENAETSSNDTSGLSLSVWSTNNVSNPCSPSSENEELPDQIQDQEQIIINHNSDLSPPESPITKRIKIEDAFSINPDLTLSTSNTLIVNSYSTKEIDAAKILFYHDGYLSSYSFKDMKISKLAKVPNQFLRGSILLATQDTVYALGVGDSEKILNQDGSHKKYNYSFPIQNFGDLTKNWEILPQMSIHRHHFASLIIENEIYAFGGVTGNLDEVHFSCEKLNLIPGSEWVKTSDMNYSRERCGVVGGFGLHVYNAARERGLSLNIFESYDLKTKTWEKLPDIKNARYEMALVVLQDKLYCIGGENLSKKDHKLDSNIVFDLKHPEKKWVQLAGMHHERSYPAAFALDNFIYVLGGNTGRIATIERYDPRVDTWKIMDNYKLPKFALCSLPEPHPENIIMKNMYMSKKIRRSPCILIK